ncbi:uncharacterized protein MONBRDRAFT_8733 [Monosiga brevicollis MX1]|uniref:Phosphoglycerate mutase n=1 Tax=Monosiga brevicollis TaxID=81824 RepID=A9V0Y8_MONBE|nr:uncharacterized protein MONBRDRAFT_8733 [Monosiga brevicollis MX1]EDQ88716.1 predicted protein [Monosiga brevicollis MX1]|eukprot:XP_001746329.1 hypothetical protein [Monosiga brevicollis MX1]
MATTRLLIVRHAERLDESRDHQAIQAFMVRHRHTDRLYDCPITASGRQQARSAASHVASAVHTHAHMPLPKDEADRVIIYCSLLQRCVQTADELAQGLPFATVLQPVAGLASCAAAVNDVGCANFNFLTDPELSALCATPVLPALRNADAFEEALDVLHARHPDHLIITVSHREGIRELKLLNHHLSHAAKRRTPRYCAVAQFSHSPDATCHWTFIQQEELDGTVIR